MGTQNMSESSAEIGARFTAAMLDGVCFASEIVNAARRVSMLHEASLWALQQCAAMSDGPILELGPYIGGSSIALAAGAHDGVISGEKGGSNPIHPEIPTEDSILDMRRNLDRVGLLDRVTIVDGDILDFAVAERVKTALNGRKAGMIFVDIDPATDIAIKLYSPMIADNAFLVIDDCSSEIAVDKAESVKAFIACGLRAKAIEPIGIYPWGTWFGRLTGSADCLADLPNLLPCIREGEGNGCFRISVTSARNAKDILHGVLLEDGRALPTKCDSGNVAQHSG